MHVAMISQQLSTEMVSRLIQEFLSGHLCLGGAPAFCVDQVLPPVASSLAGGPPESEAPATSRCTQ